MLFLFQQFLNMSIIFIKPIWYFWVVVVDLEIPDFYFCHMALMPAVSNPEFVTCTYLWEFTFSARSVSLSAAISTLYLASSDS